MSKLTWLIFGAAFVVFLIVATPVFLAPLAFHSPIPYLAAPVQVILLGLGVTLIVLTVTKIRGMLRAFLLITGASALGLPVSITLHNTVLFLLAIGLMRSSEPVFFTVAVFVCPAGPLVGAVGTITLALKSRFSVPAVTS